jgi:hypothetical protein
MPGGTRLSLNCARMAVPDADPDNAAIMIERQFAL